MLFSLWKWFCPFLVYLILAFPLTAQDQVNPTSPLNSFSLASAVETTLHLAPAIHIQETTVEAAKAQARIQTGAFDPVLNANAKIVKQRTPLNDFQAFLENTSVYNQEDLNQSVNVTQQFRNGISVSPSIQADQPIDNYENFIRAATSTMNLQIDLPLLRGLGDSASASERSSYLNVTAAELRFTNFVSQTIYNVIAQYLTLAESEQELKLENDALAREQKVYEMVNKLVEAKEISSSELIREESQLATVSVQQMSAAQRMAHAKTDLAQAIGLSSSDNLPRDGGMDSFPSFKEIPGEMIQNKEGLIQYALNHRKDFSAAKIDIQSNKVLVKAGRNALLPSLNAQLNGGYTGLDQGSDYYRIYTASLHHAAGLNWSAGLALSVPWGNNSARGHLDDLLTTLDKSSLTKEDLARTIRLNISQEVDDIVSYGNQLQKAKSAAELATKASENQKLLYREGNSTLIEVNISENDLVSAAIQFNQASLNYYSTIARLRYETSTILEEQKNGFQVDFNEALNFPTMLN